MCYGFYLSIAGLFMADVRQERTFRYAGRALLLSPLRALLACLPLLLLATLATASPTPSEYQVKAVFLFNFTQFVGWPAESFADGRAPFVIGVLGNDPFGSALDEAVRGETVNGRALVVERYRNVGELKPCQILFIDRSASSETRKALGAIEHPGTLTVSDSDAEAPPGVIIRFLNEGKKIRLRINVESARDAGLVISSKLLRPADVVGSSGSG
jgi:hypothetical protein